MDARVDKAAGAAPGVWQSPDWRRPLAVAHLLQREPKLAAVLVAWRVVTASISADDHLQAVTRDHRARLWLWRMERSRHVTEDGARRDNTPAAPVLAWVFLPLFGPLKHARRWVDGKPPINDEATIREALDAVGHPEPEETPA